VSVTLSTPDLTDHTSVEAFHRVANAAASADGYAPFNEQSLLDLTAGRREPRLIRLGGDPDDIVGAAIVGGGELDLVIVPERRAHGHGGSAAAALVTGPWATSELTAWSHGDFPAARALAARHGFEAIRTLLQLRLSSLDTAVHSGRAGTVAGTSIGPFRPGADDDEWVALNARVFAGHPEQGRLTAADLRARKAEPWFDADDFLTARDDSGRMTGYTWLKIIPGADAGEIYALGVSPDAAGRGIGRALMVAGLGRLRQRGCTAATLYVDEENRAAVRLYRSLGFRDFTVDVQYRRSAG
jgi:mycothiol synthase